VVVLGFVVSCRDVMVVDKVGLCKEEVVSDRTNGCTPVSVFLVGDRRGE